MNPISILYTGDVHARVEQFLRAAHIAHQQRFILKHEGIQSLLVDSGDIEDHRLIESDISKGAAMFQLLEAADYDCSAVGNGSALAYGPQCFADIAEASDLPILCANILTRDASPAPPPGLQPTLITHVGLAKVGLVGLTATFDNVYERVYGYKTPHPVDTTRHHARALREQGCHVVGVISHLGYDDDVQLARALSTDIDFVIGGHSHTTLEEPKNVAGIPVCHTGDYGRYVGRLDLTLGLEGEVTRWAGRLIPVPEQGPAHIKAEHVWRTITVNTQRQLKTPVGNLADALNLAKDRACGMGQLLADALRARMQADIAICASGNLRGELPVGEIILGDIIAACGLPANATVANLTGTEIMAALEYGADPEVWKQFINPRDGAIGIVQVSGMTYQIDFDAPTGQRVSEVTILGRPIIPHMIYSVAATDYELNPATGYLPDLDENLVIHDVPWILREVLIEHLEAFSPLTPGTQPRIRVMGEHGVPIGMLRGSGIEAEREEEA